MSHYVVIMHAEVPVMGIVMAYFFSVVAINRSEQTEGNRLPLSRSWRAFTSPSNSVGVVNAPGGHRNS